MKTFWDKLTKRQKYYAYGGAAFIIAVLVLQFALFPFLEERKKMQKAIASHEKNLREMIALGAHYETLKQGSEEIRRGLQRRPPDFTLYSHLERKAGEAGLKTNVKYINPSGAAGKDPYEESSVEMKLEKITLKQLTDFLYLAESPLDLVKVRRISIRKIKEAPEYLSVLIQAVTYKPSKGEAAPPGVRSR
jgi:general secretion pathway protein M